MYSFSSLTASSFSDEDKGTLAKYPGSRKNGRLYRSPPESITRCLVAFILPPVDSESVLPKLTTNDPGHGSTSSQLLFCKDLQEYVTIKHKYNQEYIGTIKVIVWKIITYI